MPRPLNFDLIAFDWDGTLFDSTRIIVRCIQAAVQDVGGARPSDEAAAYVIGLGLMQALAHAAPDVPPADFSALDRLLVAEGVAGAAGPAGHFITQLLGQTS